MPLPAPTSITRPARPASARSRCSAVPRRSDSALSLWYIRANRGCWKADRSVMVVSVSLRTLSWSGLGVEQFLVDHDGRQRAFGRGSSSLSAMRICVHEADGVSRSSAVG